MKDNMAMRQDTSDVGDDRRAKMMTMRQAQATKIKAVLTDDQKTKYDAMMASQRQRGGGGGQGGPSASAAAFVVSSRRSLEGPEGDRPLAFLRAGPEAAGAAGTIELQRFLAGDRAREVLRGV